MRSYGSRWWVIFVVGSLACSARGNFSTGGGSDAGTGSDGTVLPPNDVGTTGNDAVVGADVPPGTDVVTTVDLGTPPRCGDGTCNGTESCMSCASDCGACAPTCGDGTCNSSETCTNCPTDCGACTPRCGDGACNGSETCTSCPSDCGACAPRCGDGTCNGSETCTTCPTDCGTCAARCGDGTCNGSETCTTCPTDCGTCTSTCPTHGSCGTCVADTRCGWCSGLGTCLDGTASGPTNPADCLAGIGGWARSCGAVDSGVVDTGVPGNITTTCAAATMGLGAECGWSYAATYACSVGSYITIGCTGGTAADAGTCAAARVGTCTGDPMIRVCAGSGTQCSGVSRIQTVVATGYGEDDACSGFTCPLGRFLCPSSGAVTVYQRPYATGGFSTCTVGHL